MAQSVKTNKRHIRISADRHTIEISTDGRNWNKGLGVEESAGNYLDLITYKGKVYAVTSDSYGGKIKVLDEFGSVKNNTGNMRNMIVRFEYSDDGLLLGVDNSNVEFVLKDADRCLWERYDTWLREQERCKPNDKGKFTTENKKSSRTRRPNSSSASSSTRGFTSYSKSNKEKKLGFFGSMFSGIFGCLGTIVVVVLLIWVVVKVFSWFF